MILDPLSDKDKVRGSLHTLQVRTKIGVTTTTSNPFRTSEMHSLSFFVVRNEWKNYKNARFNTNYIKRISR